MDIPENYLLEFAVQILERIGQLTFALDLTKDYKIHEVFHASLLRRYVFNPNHVLP